MFIPDRPTSDLNSTDPVKQTVNQAMPSEESQEANT